MTGPGALPLRVAAVARIARAAWFFGNTYEAAVRTLQLISVSANRRAGILATGSPVRYFAPVAPAAVGGTAAVLVESWRTGGDRRAVAAATTTLVAALGLSAYLIGSSCLAPAGEGRRGGTATADLTLAPRQRGAPRPAGGDGDSRAAGRGIRLRLNRHQRFARLASARLQAADLPAARARPRRHTGDS